MIIYKCDLCGKELTRNVVSDRLMVDQGDFHAEVMISKKDVTNQGDLCLSCLILMLTTTPKKPRKPRSDKGSHKLKPIAEQVASTIIDKITPEKQKEVFESEKPLKLYEGKRKAGKREAAINADKITKPDISTFSIKTPEPNSSNPHYTLSLEGVGFACLTLREGVTEMLVMSGIDQKYVEAQPDSEGKRNLLDILKKGGKS